MQQWFILLVINTLRMVIFKDSRGIASFFSVQLSYVLSDLIFHSKDSNHNHCRLATATMVVIRCALICSILFINIISHASPQQVFIICCSENESQLWEHANTCNCQSLDSSASVRQLPNNSVLELTNGSCNPDPLNSIFPRWANITHQRTGLSVHSHLLPSHECWTGLQLISQ